jgi:hypothetical protein
MHYYTAADGSNKCTEGSDNSDLTELGTEEGEGLEEDDDVKVDEEQEDGEEEEDDVDKNHNEQKKWCQVRTWRTV